METEKRTSRCILKNNKKMNNGIKRIGKGLFAIFVMKVVLVCGVLVFQACQTDSNSDLNYETSEEIKNNFLDALKITSNNLSSVPISPIPSKLPTENGAIVKRDGDTTNTGSNVETQTFCLMHYDASSTSQAVDDIVNSINSVGDLMNARTQHGVTTQFDLTYNPSDTTDTGNNQDPNSFDPNDCLSIFELPVQPVIDAMIPAIVEAKNYFYSKGFSDNEITEILDGEEEYNLVPLVTALIAQEDITNSNVSIDYMHLFGFSVYAQDSESVSGRMYDCLMRSLGVTALQEAMQQGLKSTAGKRALKKAIRKIAAKTLSWIGAAWAVFEFVSCMFF
ncbi:hypothetical protein KORDIASMS9_00384 [Kordia sp. SMS9]|uniref:hypothetical protein n=1 Tax=Kordia sp. SMS9 TaxID=2282170 RepID=UPI000E106539|nr:hypothetical protein [Kordia sp. SMS9]AXG68194.1 hypothetical protein KORDIASMS9_00384 [Kordia sp. SMS9]